MLLDCNKAQQRPFNGRVLQVMAQQFRCRLFLLFVLTLLHCPVWAVSSSHIIEQAYYPDPSEAATPETISKADFLPFEATCAWAIRRALHGSG